MTLHEAFQTVVIRGGVAVICSNHRYQDHVEPHHVVQFLLHILWYVNKTRIIKLKNFNFNFNLDLLIVINSPTVIIDSPVPQSNY